MSDKVKVTRLECVKPDWNRVLTATRRTVGKEWIDKMPSDKFKKQILLAEHSPIRLLEYDFTWEDIRQWVTTHIVRHHEGCEKFVDTQRQDRKDLGEKYGVKSRDELPQGSLNDMDMTCNAQAFINISRKRLCIGCASPETRHAWECVMAYLKEVDPILESKCVPECIYRGFCPEFHCCGYCNSENYKKRLAEYRSVENTTIVQKESEKSNGLYAVEWDGIQYIARPFKVEDLPNEEGESPVWLAPRKVAENYAKKQNQKLGIK